MKKQVLLLLFFIFPTFLYSHSDKDQHAIEAMEIFGFAENCENCKNYKIREWLKFISSNLIDNVNPFYSELQRNHKGFRCKHRLLFHWGYDSEPWNKALEKRVSKYCEDYDLNIESNIKVFKAELRVEQKKRNAEINRRTEDLFGFAHGGKDASYAYFFCSMAYNIHLIGDYTSDNSDLNGLQDFNTIIRSVNNAILRLDPKLGKPINKRLENICNKKDMDVQIKADNIIAILKQEIPTFVQNAQDGSIKRRLEAKRFKFKDVDESQNGFFTSIGHQITRLWNFILNLF